MRNRLAAAAVSLLATLVCVPPALAAPEAPDSDALAAGARVYLADSQNPEVPRYRPRKFFVSGQSSFYVGKARWSHWGRRTARGRGVGAVNNCRPSCAEGSYSRGPIRVKLSRPRRKCGRVFFTRGVFSWPGRKPSGVPRRWKWRMALFPCA